MKTGLYSVFYDYLYASSIRRIVYSAEWNKKMEEPSALNDNNSTEFHDIRLRAQPTPSNNGNALYKQQVHNMITKKPFAMIVLLYKASSSCRETSKRFFTQDSIRLF